MCFSFPIFNRLHKSKKMAKIYEIPDNIFTSETTRYSNISDEKGEEKNTFMNVTA